MEGYRLSPQQQELLDAFSSTPQGRPYTHVCAIEIDGTVDANRLGRALVSVLQSTEILRTYYPQLSGVRVQAVSDEPIAVPIANVDVSQLGYDEQSLRVSEFCSAHADSLPDEPGPIVRATLLRLNVDKHVLVLMCSSLASDATGLLLLAERLTHIYVSPSPGTVAESDELQYVDIAEWFHDLLGEPDTEDGRRFWQQIVSAGIVRPEFVPFSSVSGPDDFAPALVQAEVDPSTYDALGSLQNELDAGYDDILLAAWTALLWRLNDCDDFTLGLHCNGRTFEELAQSQGLLSKLLPFSVKCDEKLSFGDHVARISRQREELENHQEYFQYSTLTKLGEDEKLAIRLLETAFSFSRAPSLATTDNVVFRLSSIQSHERPFLVRLDALQSDNRLHLNVWYDSSRTTTPVAEQLSVRLKKLLEFVVSNSACPVVDLPILTERDEQIIRTNVAPIGREPHPIDDLLLDRFLSVASQTPSAPAVSCGAETLSYEALRDRSGRLANLLRTRGAGPGERVAICMQRSVNVIVGILAILRSGAAYVPLDPEYPANRIDYVLRDSGARLILTDSSTLRSLDRLPDDVRPVTLGDPIPDSCSTEQRVPDLNSESLAYILYTSGSTGQPKGVAVTHDNLAYSTSARLSFYEDTPKAFLLLSSVAFDSSVAGIFWTLSTGGHLVFPSGDNVIDADVISGAVRTHDITHCLCLPSVYNLLLDTADLEALQSLRCVIVAGESCPPTLVAKHGVRLNKARLYNEYGPTECTVWSTACECKPQSMDEIVPIGRAIPGATAVVLDPRLNHVPAGCRGELYIGGRGVASGYWKQPEMTADRFINISDSIVGEIRAYRTGDVARLDENGTIQFLGRRDFQVKINGYRIELEEVESAIQRGNGVVDAVVVTTKANSDSPQLAAFMRLAPGVSVDAVRSELELSLPRFMMPSFFTVVEDYPRTSNGKIDRAATAALPIRSTSNAFVEPRDALEELQADIWAEILGREEVGVQDDFFKLGGHSILATRLIAQLRDVLQISIPIRVLFDNPTIAEFTAALREESSLYTSLQKIEAALTEMKSTEDTAQTGDAAQSLS